MNVGSFVHGLNTGMSILLTVWCVGEDLKLEEEEEEDEDEEGEDED